MPSLGSDMEAGTLIEWEKQPGDIVHRGDIIAVVETQKGAIEIEVYEDGTLEKVLVELGDKVPVGTPLAIIGNGSVPSVSETNKQTSVADIENADQNATTSMNGITADNTADELGVVVTETVASSTTPTAGSERLRITPAAKQLANASNIDLASLAGSGPASAIVLDDVRAALRDKHHKESSPTLEADKSKPDSDTKQNPATEASPMDGMRAAIAAAMSRSKREIPHYYLSHTVQLDNLMSYLTENNAQRTPDKRVVSGAAFIKAVALAAKKYTEFNGIYEDGQYAASDTVHIGMAINIRGGGLVAPAIHNADTLSVDDTMVKLKDLVTRVRSGRFKAAELSDPTLTISSLGDRGVDSLYGVIFPPQVAIVGFGTPVSTVQVVDGNVIPIHTVTITLAADHRVSDGHRGSLFLRAIGQHLNTPEKLQ